MAQIRDIGSDLVAARRAMGITQRELGERVGVTQPQIARWEASRYRSTTLERVDQVARELGYEITTTGTLLAAESRSTWGRAPLCPPDSHHDPVRDLGEIAVRLRAHGTELHHDYGLKRIGVFGSFATGRQAFGSDVDLLVETDNPGGFRYISAAQRVEQILQRNVDFVRPDLLKDRLRRRVLDEVVYVWQA